MEEIWKTTTINDNYAVSNTGKVKNRYTGRILKPGRNQVGHLQVVINYKSTLVHKLVADAFMPNDNPKLTCIKHIDGNNENCSVDNLKRVTKSENSKNRKYGDATYIIQRVRYELNKRSDKEIQELCTTLIEEHSLYLEF